MINKYDNYKKSNISWIGDIPDHWKMNRIKDVVKSYNNFRVPISADVRVKGEYPYYGATKIIDYVKDYAFDGRFLLIGEDGAPFFDKTKDLSFIVRGKFWVNNHAHVLKERNIFSNLSFIKYYLNSKNYSDIIKGSTRQKLNKIDLMNIVIPLPKKDEQDAIANYLDDKVGSLDKLIPALDDQIENMKDYKKAIISEIINEMLIAKEEKVRLKDLIDYTIGGIWGDEVKGPDNKKIVIRVSDFNKDSMKIIDDNLTYRNIDSNSFLTRKLKKGDILIEKSGGGGKNPVGNLVVFDKNYDAVFSNFTTLIRFNKNKCYSGFMKYVFKHMYNSRIVEKSIKQNTGIQNLDMNHYLSNSIAIPTIEKQKEIAKQLDEKISNIDEAIIALKEQKQNMIDYKKALIHDVVTGKIKVYEEE